jgi:type II secretory pathway predicted ATPase ExeA
MLAVAVQRDGATNRLERSEALVAELDPKLLIDAGFFETEHHTQVSRDIQAAITRGGLIALTAIIGSSKTILGRRLRTELERENKVIVSRSLSLDKTKIAMPLLVAALFYDLSTEKSVTISNNSERREPLKQT